MPLLVQRGHEVRALVREWYVLGPGHRWPYAVIPIYWLMAAIPQTRDESREFGLVTIAQMVSTVVASVDDPPVGARVVGVPEIRRARPIH